MVSELDTPSAHGHVLEGGVPPDPANMLAGVALPMLRFSGFPFNVPGCQERGHIKIALGVPSG